MPFWAVRFLTRQKAANKVKLNGLESVVAVRLLIKASGVVVLIKRHFLPALSGSRGSHKSIVQIEMFIDFFVWLPAPARNWLAVRQPNKADMSVIVCRFLPVAFAKSLRRNEYGYVNVLLGETVLWSKTTAIIAGRYLALLAKSGSMAC